MLERYYEVYPPLETYGQTELIIPKSLDKTNSVWLGRLAERAGHLDVWLSVSKELVVSIVGKRGSGKSFTAGTLFEGFGLHDGSISEMTEPRVAVVFDLLDIFWTTKFVPTDRHASLRKQLQLLGEWGLSPKPPQVRVLVPSGFRGPSTISEALDFQLSTSDMEVDDWASLLQVDLVREPMGQLLLMAFNKVRSEGWEAIGEAGARKAVHEYEIEDLVDCIQADRELTSPETGFDLRTRRAVISRFLAIKTLNLFVKRGTRISQILRPNEISIILLGNIPESIRDVICRIFLGKILQTRYQVSQAQKQLLVNESLGSDETERLQKIIAEGIPRTWVFIDEVQNIAPSDRKTAASDIFTRLVKQGRNFGIGVVMTSQQPQSIDRNIMSQVDMIIAHQLAVEKDIAVVQENMKSGSAERVVIDGRDISFSELLRQLPSGEGYALVTCTDVERFVLVKVRPRVAAHGGFET